MASPRKRRNAKSTTLLGVCDCPSPPVPLPGQRSECVNSMKASESFSAPSSASASTRSGSKSEDGGEAERGGADPLPASSSPADLDALARRAADGGQRRVVDELRRSGEVLEEASRRLSDEGLSVAGAALDLASARLLHAGRLVEEHRGDDLAERAQRWASRHPTLMLSGAALVGCALGRLFAGGLPETDPSKAGDRWGGRS